MRTATTTETEWVHRLPENLMSQLARGREWATPGVQAALQRAVDGLDTGFETASPRLQILLRRLADELAGGVETITPRAQQRLKRVGPRTAARGRRSGPAPSARPVGRMWLLILGLAALVAGAAAWRSMQAANHKAAPTGGKQEPGPTDPNVDADLASGRM